MIERFHFKNNTDFSLVDVEEIIEHMEVPNYIPTEDELEFMETKGFYIHVIPFHIIKA